MNVKTLEANRLKKLLCKVVRIKGELKGYGVAVSYSIFSNADAVVSVKLASGKEQSFNSENISRSINPFAILKFKRLKYRWWKCY
jgi:hypothetical protein